MRYRFTPLAITTLLAAGAAQADHLEELVVTASHDTRTIDVSDEFSVAADVTQLLKTKIKSLKWLRNSIAKLPSMNSFLSNMSLVRSYLR